MSRHDRLIKQLWQSDADRAIARRFVEQFGDLPGMADRIEPMLKEAASAADKVAAGELSMADARSYLTSFAADGLGTPPHLMTGLTEWFEGAGAEAASEATPPQQDGGEQPTGRSAQPSAPAQPAPPAAPAAPPQPAPAAAQSQPPAAAGPTRAQLQQEITRWEAAMRSPEGSAEWKSYWKEGGNGAYLSALQALESAPEASPAPATIAAGGTPSPAAPAPAAEPGA